MNIYRIELWRWRVRDRLTGKLYVTRYLMTEDEAQVRHREAEKVEWSLEVRRGPEWPWAWCAALIHAV
jgi:hypothetical protein